MAEHKECKHYEECGYRNDIGVCPNWCGQFKHKDDVRVVRCKDCIHWYKPEDVCLKIYSDGAVSPYAWQVRNPDDFCSYGERRTE